MRALARCSAAALLLPCLVAADVASRADDGQKCWGVRSSCRVEGNLRVARRVDRVPDAIRKLFGGRRIRVYEIDLDSDGRPDYIVEDGPTAPATFRTCFVDSSAHVRSCAPGGGDGFAYYWFAQLDGDPMLELFAMEGDEDSDEYRIQKLDPKTWKRRDLVRIDPILFDVKDRKKSFWGYPWDVVDLLLDRRGGRILIRAAPRGTGRLYREDYEPVNVVIFFTGTPTQEGPPGGFAAAVKASRYMSLDEIVRLSRSRPASPPAAPVE